MNKKELKKRIGLIQSTNKFSDEDKIEMICTLFTDEYNNLLAKAKQFQIEQKFKLDNFSQYNNNYEIGTLNGIERIVGLIERHNK